MLDELSGPDIEAGVKNGSLGVAIAVCAGGVGPHESQPLFEEDLVLNASPGTGLLGAGTCPCRNFGRRRRFLSVE
ncbi:MAG: hypothetical protein IPL14_08425 [Nitrospira sp.]|nr:hypothetical protein [Nitrospira sp.]